MSDLPSVVWTLIIYAIVESVLDVINKTSLWLLRQFFGPVRRFIWGDLS